MDNTSYKIGFGQRLKARREEVHMTQEELAKHLGYTKSFISRVEKGEHEMPQIKVLMAADILQTTTAYLMGWNRDMNTRTGLNDEERQLIAYYNALSREGQIAMLAMVKGLVDSGAYIKAIDSKAIS